MHTNIIGIVLVIVLFFGCASTPRFTRGPARSRPAVAGPQDKALPAPMAPSSGKAFQEGEASYYAHDFHGKKTANGETYDMNAFTAAHQTLPFNTSVRVVVAGTGQSTVVRINDRGPFAKDRIIDLSLAAAKKIGLIGPGHAQVQLFIEDTHE